MKTSGRFSCENGNCYPSRVSRLLPRNFINKKQKKKKKKRKKKNKRKYIKCKSWKALIATVGISESASQARLLRSQIKDNKYPAALRLNSVVSKIRQVYDYRYFIQGLDLLPRHTPSSKVPRSCTHHFHASIAPAR
jgi:mannitol-specific phosphotransferase system IIBC component